MPTDLGMEYITRHVLGTCRHTRHFCLDPQKYKVLMVLRSIDTRIKRIIIHFDVMYVLAYFNSIP